jgi:hypothetical protein
VVVVDQPPLVVDQPPLVVDQPVLLQNIASRNVNVT